MDLIYVDLTQIDNRVHLCELDKFNLKVEREKKILKNIKVECVYGKKR